MVMKLPVVTPQTESLQRASPDSYTLTGYNQSSQEKFIVPKLRMIDESELKNSVYSYTPMRVIPDSNRPCHWSIFQSEPENKEVIPLNGMSGEFYQECGDGIYSKGDESERRRIFNIKIKLVRVIEIWNEEGLKGKNYVCKIFSDVWCNQYREVVIPSDRYKDLFKVIHKLFPEIFLQDTTSEIVQEYLTDVYRRDIDEADIDIQSEKIGWLKIYGKIAYMIGNNDFYKSYYIPVINRYDRVSSFNAGMSFLRVGNGNETISILWLMAHVAFTNYWFNEGGKRFSGVVYLQGATNLLKTSVVKIITNPFDNNRDNATIRITSTMPGIRNILSMLPDTLICVDDFSNTEPAERKKAVENAEYIIRALGDGIFPVKMNVKDFSQAVRESVRSTVILTGEENLPLGNSSQYRIVTLSVEEGTFDGEALRYFQNHPEIMAQYFSIYVQYLTERGKIISNEISKKITEYANEFSKEMSIRRFADTAAFFTVQVDVLFDFAIWVGISAETANQFCNTLKANIKATMTRNQENGTKIKSTLMFLIALWQSFNSSSSTILAESENTYVKDESKFLGFHDEVNNFIWVKPAETYNIVVNYYKKQGKNFLVQFDTLKQVLLREGYIDGILPENDKDGQYVKRAKRDSRKYMLVLKVAEVEKVLETLKEEI